MFTPPPKGYELWNLKKRTSYNPMILCCIYAGMGKWLFKLISSWLRKCFNEAICLWGSWCKNSQRMFFRAELPLSQKCWMAVGISNAVLCTKGKLSVLLRFAPVVCVLCVYLYLRKGFFCSGLTIGSTQGTSFQSCVLGPKSGSRLQVFPKWKWANI